MSIRKNHGGSSAWVQRGKVVLRNPPRSVVVLVICFISLGEFVLDINTRLGISDWVWYFIPLLLSLQLGRRVLPFLLAAIFSMLIIVGFFLSPPGLVPHLSLISRGLGICVLWLMAFLIDAHLKADIALRTSEERYRLVVEDQTAAISRFTSDGTLIYINNVYCQLVGRTSQELLGTRWQPRAVAEDLPVIEDQLRALSPTNPVVIIENRIYNSAGEVRWFQFINRAMFDASGTLIETQSVGQDITERKLAEEKLKDSHKLLTAMCDSSTDAIYIKDIRGRYLIFNQHAANFVGKDPSEVIGQDDYYIFPADEAQGLMERDRKIMESGLVRTYEESMTSSGTLITYLSTKGPLFDSTGRVNGLFGISRDITERKRVEQGFKQMEERYRNLAESSPDAIFILDRNSTIQYINRVGARWLGKPVEEALGRARTDFFPPELAQQQQVSLERVFATGEVFEAERSQKFPDGEKWLETRLVPLRDEQGKVFSVMGISRDLTERRRAEIQLATLGHAVESTAEMICITDLADRFIFANTAFLKGYGYTEPELLGKTPEILFSPRNPPMLLREILDNTRIEGWRGEVLDRRKDGSEFWVNLSTSQIKIADGRVIGLMGVSTDITARKLADLKLHELAAIVQNTDDAIISITSDEIILNWNRGAERLLGYTAGEAIGKNISIILLPEQIEKSKEVTNKILCGGPGESYESVHRHKDGTLRQVSIRYSPVTNSAGKLISIAAILRDIRARKQLEKTVLEISSDERRRIGHELHDGLGQQLAGIAYESKALENALVEESSGYVAEAKAIVGHINEAIQQTRSLARGFDPVDFEVDGLPAALQNLATQTGTLYGLECVFQCNEERLKLESPVNLALYRIAQESINNAVKHGRASRIEIELFTSPPKLSLAIKDNGRGFLLNEKSRQGMGLRIMTYRADTLGGYLSIHSEADAGTEIKCTLPLVIGNQ